MLYALAKQLWPGALLALALTAQGPTLAAGGTGDPTRLAFAAIGDSQEAVAIDTNDDRVVARFALGLAPDQIALSRTIPVLIAIDGQSNRAAVADLIDGRTATIPLAFPARRLLLSADGRQAAVSDLAGGNVAIFSLPGARPAAQLSGLPPLSDLMFTEDGRGLIIASQALDGLGIVDVAQGRVTARISSPQPNAGGIAAFTRSPDGRRVFAIPPGGGPIGVFDLAAGRSLAQLPAGKGPVKATPSGTGAYLLVTDEATRTMSILHDGDFAVGATLPGGTNMTTPYSGWFDSVAFVPSQSRPIVLVYDLWRLQSAGEITLPAAPGQGTVTADGAKLYLPIAKDGAVAVIDTRNRRLAGLITVGGHPNAVVVAGGYGICH